MVNTTGKPYALWVTPTGGEHGCLDHDVLYDETIAWGHRPENNLTQAA